MAAVILFWRIGGQKSHEVWAGKPVNMAAKLAAMCGDSELLASDRFFDLLTSRYALKSCGCPNNEVVDLWKERDVSDDDQFDFDTTFVLEQIWCKTHGKDFCTSLLCDDE